MRPLHHKHPMQPSLFDRLVEVAPHACETAQQSGALTEAELRESVRRDLAALFNTTRLEASLDLRDFPEVQRSCLNYGIAELMGDTSSGVDLEEIGQMLRDVILRYEPRLDPRTLEIRPRITRAGGGRNALAFDIEAELRASPVPLPMYLRSELDLESGAVAVITVGSPEMP